MLYCYHIFLYLCIRFLYANNNYNTCNQFHSVVNYKNACQLHGASNDKEVKYSSDVIMPVSKQGWHV